MEALLEEHEKLSRKGNLSKSIDDIQKTIDLLMKAREAIASSKYPSHSVYKSFSGFYPFTLL